MFDLYYFISFLFVVFCQSADTGGGAGESLQLLPPELLQMCIQQLTQQALSTSAEEGGLMEDEPDIAGSDSSDSGTSAGLLQQVRV